MFTNVLAIWSTIIRSRHRGYPRLRGYGDDGCRPSQVKSENYSGNVLIIHMREVAWHNMRSYAGNRRNTRGDIGRGGERERERERGVRADTAPPRLGHVHKSVGHMVDDN